MKAVSVQPDEDDDLQTVTPEWICKKLVIHRHTLTKIIAGDDDFPKAIVLPSGGRRFEKAAFLRWMKARKK
jgi:hypothetical protein